MKENKLWFRAKRYGWGWTPSLWQGWAVIALYIVVLLVTSARVTPSGSEMTDLLNIASAIVPATACLLIICLIKGERPRWSWGKKGAGEKVNEVQKKEAPFG